MASSFIEKKITSTEKFLDNVRNMDNNTLNFENCSYREKYTNKDIKYFENTDLNLTYFRNILMEKYRDRILRYRNTATISDTQKATFDQNPYLAASEILGDINYWWLILLVNKKMNVEEFTKLSNKIYIPNVEDIKNCITNELTKNKTLGELEE